MHQDPEHEDYDDDEYNYYPKYNDYGYPEQYSKKFDIDWAAWEKWLSEAIKGIVEEDNNIWSFGHNISDGSKKSSPKKLNDKYFMYLGVNNYSQDVWKSKYFIEDKIETFYKNHIIQHAKYFLIQPSYYKGMFDILN